VGYIEGIKDCLLIIVECGKLTSSCEMSVSGFWWKFIDWLVEIFTSCEVSECGWKFVDLLVEFISSCEVSKCEWKFVYWFVEITSSCE
jgi:hypothetical protein